MEVMTRRQCAGREAAHARCAADDGYRLVHGDLQVAAIWSDQLRRVKVGLSRGGRATAEALFGSSALLHTWGSRPHAVPSESGSRVNSGDTVAPEGRIVALAEERLCDVRGLQEKVGVP